MRDSTLSRRELEAYRRQLLNLIARLRGEAEELRDESLCLDGAGSVGGNAQESDLCRREAEAELALALLGTQEDVLAEATAALARISQKKYGRCESCGTSIARARLNALPYARRCIRCAWSAEAGIA